MTTTKELKLRVGIRWWLKYVLFACALLGIKAKPPGIRGGLIQSITRRGVYVRMMD